MTGTSQHSDARSAELGSDRSLGEAATVLNCLSELRRNQTPSFLPAELKSSVSTPSVSPAKRGLS
jgi:hypothetical protein